MKIIDPGHKYSLISLDGDHYQELQFVKRFGPNFPGNINRYPGTTMQDVLRAVLHRLEFVNNQIPDHSNLFVKQHLMESIWHLESRAAKRHGRILKLTPQEIINAPICLACGHNECNKHGLGR